MIGVKTLQTKVWNVSFVAVVSLFVLFQTGTNYYFDHYGVFDSGMSSKQPINLNQRFGKIEHLKGRQDEFNAFLLGSSRLGHFNTSFLSKTASESEGKPLNFYNLSVFSGVPKDYLLFLRYLKANKYPLESVVIGLDMYPFFLPPDLSKPDFKHHPDVTGESSLGFYLSYLFRTSFVYLLTEANYFFGDEAPVYEHHLETGEYKPVRAIRLINEDFASYWSREIKKAEQGIEAFQSANHVVDPSQLEDLIHLVQWLKANVAEYRFFVNPRHPINDAYYSEEEKNAFNNLIVREIKGSLVDVSGVECLMHDNRNFYDLMHYKPLVADQIVESIYRHSTAPSKPCSSEAFVSSQSRLMVTNRTLDGDL